MTNLDPIDLYATLLGLNQDEREEFKARTLDEFVENVVADYALVWRGRQRAATPATLIRRSILLRAAFDAMRYSIRREVGNNRVEVAFALWLCDCVERRADELTKTEPLTAGRAERKGE